MNKILVLTDWYHPGFKAGGPIQSCRNLVLALKDSFDFFIFTTNKDLGEKFPYKNVIADIWIDVNQSEHIYYCQNETYSRGKLKSVIETINPDVVYLNSMFSVRFTIIPLIILFFSKYKGKIVLAPRGMLNDSALYYKPLKKKLFLNLFRLLGLHKIVDFHATDFKEQQDISKHFPNAKSLSLAPNFANQQAPKRLLSEKSKCTVRLVFVSRISPVKNLKYIFDLLSKHPFPGTIHLTVAGEIEDQAYWQSCLDIAKSFPDNIRFNYAGPIEHSILLDWLQQFHFMILPTFGENFGHAIFEAFIAGKPVIISDKTPWRGLQDQRLGWDISLTNEQGFVNAINQALGMDQDEYQQWSKACGEFADNYRNNNETRKRYLELFNS